MRRSLQHLLDDVEADRRLSAGAVMTREDEWDLPSLSERPAEPVSDPWKHDRFHDLYGNERFNACDW